MSGAALPASASKPPEAETHQHRELLARALAQGRDLFRRAPPLQRLQREGVSEAQPRAGEYKAQVPLEPVEDGLGQALARFARGFVQLAGKKPQSTELLIKTAHALVCRRAGLVELGERRADVVGAIGFQLAFDAGLDAVQVGQRLLGRGKCNGGSLRRLLERRKAGLVGGSLAPGRRVAHRGVAGGRHLSERRCKLVQLRLACGGVAKFGSEPLDVVAPLSRKRALLDLGHAGLVAHRNGSGEIGLGVAQRLAQAPACAKQLFLAPRRRRSEQRGALGKVGVGRFQLLDPVRRARPQLCVYLGKLGLEQAALVGPSLGVLDRRGSHLAQEVRQLCLLCRDVGRVVPAPSDCPAQW